ncbi:MAG: helix-turn-helix domain-containing protein [Lachnospiraceae bacterium]|jgi:DNA-binding XRE family transcriptional regulator|nr:helix-turn-helix domain-containing protein [Lachnospiraceae bacterium]
MKEIRDLYVSLLKQYLSEEIKMTRKERSLTQEAMAEKLAIERRTYCNIEKGENMCGTVSFILFLAYECDDSIKFLKNVRELLEELRKDIK